MKNKVIMVKMNCKRRNNGFSKFLIIILVFSALLQNSCNQESLKLEDINEASLVGTWELTADSLVLIKEKRNCCEDVKLLLKLNKNHIFVLKNMPDCWENGFGICSGTVRSYEGRWEIFQLNENSPIRLLLRMKQGGGREFNLVKRDELHLGFNFGDADSSDSYFLYRNQ